MRPASLAVLLAASLALWATGCSREPAPQPHLLLISIDTLSRDALRAFAPEAELLPAFDRLAAESVRFDQAISPASWTLPAHASLLTGLYPHRHGAVHRRSLLAPAVPTLAQELAGAGYTTAAFTDGGFVDAKYGLARGFERYDAQSASGEPAPAWLPLGGKPPEVRGFEPFARAIAHLEHRDDPRPQLLFVHTYALHDYFHDHTLSRRRARRGAAAAAGSPAALSTNPPARSPGGDARARAAPEAGARITAIGRANLRCLLGDGPCSRRRWERLAALYRRELRRMDAELARLLAAARRSLDDRPLWIVLTSDHGEAFGAPARQHHGGELHPEVLAVPLLVSGPGAKPARAGSRVSLVDVAPTLLELAGVEPPEDLDGRSLAPLLGEGWRAGLLRRRLEDRALHAEEHYYWWRNGRRASARDIRATPIAVALWRGDWWYVRSLAGEQVLRWPPRDGARAEGDGPSNARAVDAPSRAVLSELRREARALASKRVVSTDPRPEDRELDEQLRSLGYGGGP